jgi:hypothetical protein
MKIDSSCICVRRVSRIGDKNIPYTETLAYQDWAPFSYLDGYYDDPSTGGTNKRRAELITEGATKKLQVHLPKGCYTSACAMQIKSAMVVPTESATLKFKCACHSAMISAAMSRFVQGDARNPCLSQIIEAPLKSKQTLGASEKVSLA